MTAEGYDPFKFGEVKLEDQKAAAEARRAAGQSIPEDLLFAERSEADAATGPVKPMTEQPVPPGYKPPPPKPAAAGSDDGWAPLREAGDDLPGVRPARRDSGLAHLFDKPAGAGAANITGPGDVPADTADQRPRRNPLPQSRAAREAGPGDLDPGRPASRPRAQDPGADRTPRREPLPQASDRPVYHGLKRQSPNSRLVPAVILLGGLGAASFFCFMLQNYPVAIFLALVSIVAAPLVRLLMNSSHA